jgi:hypothetical protein
MTMRSFTPERWLRFQDVSDPRARRAAHEDWEHAITNYRRALQRVLPECPPQLRRFIEGGSLHDTTVLAIWRGRSPLSILVRPEPPADPLILLVYTLVDTPEIDPEALPAGQRTLLARWMYDEVGMEKTAPSSGAAEGPVFAHSILLSNGWQLAIRFRRFEYASPETLLAVQGQETLSCLSASA